MRDSIVMPAPIVTLLTDFGTRDHYVAAMKGVLLGLAPRVCLVDVTHEIEPFDVVHGAVVLEQIWNRFPEGTVHLAVVDPGVGTDRRILVARYGGRFVVAPDNGLITLVHRSYPAQGAFVVEERRYFLSELSGTFHGRDIMAPVAAHLVSGTMPQRFGRATDHVKVLDLPEASLDSSGTVQGAGLYADRFGTIVSNIPAAMVSARSGDGFPGEVLVNGSSIGSIRTTFSDVPIGTPLAFVGSTGKLEIAVNQGRAVDRFGPPRSLKIDVHRD